MRILPSFLCAVRPVTGLKLAIYFCLGINLPAYAQQTIDDFSVLPENLAGEITSNPNVLIILDNSTSMTEFIVPRTGSQPYTYDENTGLGYLPTTNVLAPQYDPSSTFSNSFQVRQAMRNVLNSPTLRGRLNVGLMAFGQSNCIYSEVANRSRVNRDNQLNTACKNARGFNIRLRGLPAGAQTPATNGLGVLRANILPLESSHLDTLNALLGPEPSPWTAENVALDTRLNPKVDFSRATLPVHGIEHPFFTQGAVNGSEVPIVSLPNGNVYSNLTPLTGVLETAARYLFRNDQLATSIGPPQKLLGGLRRRESNLGGEPVKYLSESQCEGPITVILLTDGFPSQLPPPSSNLDNGIGRTTADNPAVAVTAAINAAATLRYRGSTTQNSRLSTDQEIKVYVIGYQLELTSAANKIARAGGTGRALNTDSAEEVEEAFTQIFNEILEAGASRSGLSIISSPDSATGSFIQPSFTPLIQQTDVDGTAQQVVWTGEVRNFFIDRFGNFREDSLPPRGGEGNNRLDSGDKGFRILFDEATDQTYVERFDVGEESELSNFTGGPDGQGGFRNGLIDVEDLQAIWSVSDQLNRLADDIDSIRGNREYRSPVRDDRAARFIFSWLDRNADQRFSTNETVNFSWNNDASVRDEFTSADLGVFDLPENLDNDLGAEQLINFVRGFQAPENNRNRNRIIDEYKFLLGDIVHSTPVQVEAPTALSSPNPPARTEALRDSYLPYAKHYADRRRMIYVGANDGMLHAFNGGFWRIDDETGSIEVQTAQQSETRHELGDEIWAFIPNAVLPHLKFLQDSSYAADQHVAYVDGSLTAREVKIFDDAPGACEVPVGGAVPNGCTYVNGWGTILVGGLGFGGGEYTADFDNDGNIEDHETSRSSFFIIDVTNPERPPILLDEVSAPGLEFTVSVPALVRLEGDSPTTREYRLVFGSGPNDLATATNTSGKPASLFVYNFKSRNGLTPFPLNGASSSSFIGDMTSADWNLDDIDDAVYLGTVAGDSAHPDGKLFRATLTGSNTTDELNTAIMFNVGRPIQHSPVIPSDHPNQQDKYVLFGTGRTYSLLDLDFTYSKLNRLYGLKERFTGSILDHPLQFQTSSILSSQILNTTNANPAALDEGDDILPGRTRAEVLEAFRDDTTRPIFRGWFFDLPENTSRLSASGVTLEELVFFNDFQPQNPETVSSDQCVPDGGSFLSVLDYRTGLFPSAQRLEFGASANTGENTANFLNFRISSSLLGSADILIVGDDADGNTDFKFLAPGSNQEITDFEALLKNSTTVVRSGRKSWREIDLSNIDTN
ncbi:MAG: hypothetical protein AAF431_11970 [Pseudomonadota bacterium]